MERLLNQIKEFFAAARSFNSYNIPRNPYIWFGILWGLQLPIIVAIVWVVFDETAFSLSDITTFPKKTVVFLSLCYPLLFGVIFGILGTIRQEKNKKIKALIEELQHISRTDPLTGLANRRQFINSFQENVARNKREGTALSLLFFDIDHFKAINDRHGHHFGDVILTSLAKLLASNSRPYDSLARWGGEEFLLLLPKVNENEAFDIAERIRKQARIKFSKEFDIPFSISIGVAQHRNNDSMDIFIDQADNALYAAKQTGRNRVIKFSELEKTWL